MPEMHKDRDAGKIRFQYMEREIVTANVEVDYAVKNVKYQPLTKDIYALPFGVNMSPSIADVSRFFESRCFPKDRRNCKQLLEDLGIDDYVPLDIVRKTHGRQLEDYCWILFEGEELDYERDIKLRD